MTTTTSYVTLWVCIDCRDCEASGVLPDPDDFRPGTVPDPWSVDQGPGRVTPGLMFPEHHDDCVNFDHDTGEYLGIGDCFCEDQDFSWSPCHGCGSHLGGSRHAYTYHLEDGER